MRLQNSLFLLALFFVLLLATQARAEAESLSTSGTLVVLPAFAEVRQANDQAVATLAIEEQDRDKAAAASRVNQKMKQGSEILRKADPQAILKTQGYYSYPVYADELAPQNGAPAKVRVPLSWRVGQYLQLTTSNLDGLPKTVAAAQRLLTLNGLQFGLAPATVLSLDKQRLAATYQNLTERITAIAAAMGRKVSDAVLDTLDFEGSGAYAQQDRAAPAAMMAGARMKSAAPQVEEPSFEPGETTLQMHLVAKVKFK